MKSQTELQLYRSLKCTLFGPMDAFHTSKIEEGPEMRTWQQRIDPQASQPRTQRNIKTPGSCLELPLRTIISTSLLPQEV
jgi:hypothetical protein